MATGQGAFSVAADAAALEALEVRLGVLEAERGARHVATLRTVLQLHAVYGASGMTVSTVPHAALALGCSEGRAARLLAEAIGLAELPGALEAVECGLLTVEQATTVLGQLAVLPTPQRLAVWRRLQERLVAEAERGSVLPPARLAELLRRWVLEADPADAVQRRRRAEDGRRVDYRLHADGLGDLFATGFRGPDLQAVLSRIAAGSVPWGAEDDRTAEQRRFDAFKDLLLGRDVLPLDDDERHCGPGCDCRAGAPVPCGSELLVHLTLGAGLGTSDEPAVLVGHGPIEADLLAELLLAGPRLRPVWVDQDGVPVAVGARVLTPQRGDPDSVRAALLELAALPPPPPQPRHPHDHAPPDGAADGLPGPYRLPRWLRRLIEVRSPRCEWPGCGARAVRCDAEHDRAWPGGPTCSCNLGPCCRRHHQVKQRGWVKTRGLGSAVRWTGPTGRSWLSPPQHPPPGAPVRPLPPVSRPGPLDQLSDWELEDELWELDLLPEDDWSNHIVPVDHEPDDSDRLGHRIQHTDTRWTLDLTDPYR